MGGNRVKQFRKISIIQASIVIALLIVSGMLHHLPTYVGAEYLFIGEIGQLMSVIISIAIFSYWTVSIYMRIMQKHVRTFIVLLGINMIFWIILRSIKWYAFTLVIFEDRILWYMYYIPILLIPLLFLYISLCLNQAEDFRLNRKWYFLFIPTFIFIVLVLTNDMHQLVFINNTSIHAYGADYSHGIGYYFIISYIIILAIVSLVQIIHKFSVFAQTRKASLLPLSVLVLILIYGIAYIIKPNYGIGYYLDLTMFICTMVVFFLETCIKTKMIPSNKGHQTFFYNADIHAQILNKQGEVVYSSDKNLKIKEEDFESLKIKQNLNLDENTKLYMSPIHKGYVAWSEDISVIVSKIKELEKLNRNLHKEVDLLKRENNQKSETARLNKLHELQNMLIHEIIPYSERIKSSLDDTSNVTIKEKQDLIFETSMTSTYLKRKVNLILTAQTEKEITSDEMQRCFQESFQLLRIFNKTCEIHIVKECSMDLSTAMLSYDLYQYIIEKVNYEFEIVYVTYNQENNKMVFTVSISKEKKLNQSEIEFFELYKFTSLQASLKMNEEDECYIVTLTIPY